MKRTWTQNRKLKYKYVFIFVFVLLFGFSRVWQVFGQIWAQQPAQRTRLEKHNINQRKLARDIDSKAPRN